MTRVSQSLLRSMMMLLLCVSMANVPLSSALATPSNRLKQMQEPAMAMATASISLSAVELLAKAIGNRRLVLLGETHGTREIPEMVRNLVADRATGSGQQLVGVEIDSREQPRIDSYLSSRESDTDRNALLAGDHWQDAMHDGRDSQATLALIERVRMLRVDGRDVSLSRLIRQAPAIAMRAWRRHFAMQ